MVSQPLLRVGSEPAIIESKTYERGERGVGALNAEIERLIASQERKHFAGDTHRFRKRVAPLRFAQPPRQPQPNRASGCAGLTFEFDCE